MKTKHTPGPWRTDPLSNRSHLEIFSSKYGRRIARVIKHPGDEPETPMRDFTNSEQDRADARLIAAAPEMLSLLERITKIIDRDANGGDRYDSFVYASGIQMEIDSILLKIQGES